MKRTLISAITAVALGASFAPLASAQPDYQARQHHERGDRDNHAQQQSQRDNNGRDRGHRRAWRDTRSDARWDDSQHNGYYQNNRWRYGPPPTNYYGRRGFALGYRPWARGQHLGYYNGRYAEVDYRREHLRRPYRGYHWVRDDQGDYLLAAIVSGLVASVIINSDRRDR